MKCECSKCGAVWESVDCKSGMASFASHVCDSNINHPSHYTFGKFEVIDVLEDWFPDKPLLWQVGKYISRASHKGKPLEDLKKARFYLDRQIKHLEEAEK